MKFTLHRTPLEKYSGTNTTKLVFTELSRSAQLKERGSSDRVLEVPIGRKRTEMTPFDLQLLCRHAIEEAKRHRIERIAISLDLASFPKLKSLSDESKASLVAQHFEMANYEFRTFKTRPKGGWGEVREVVVCGNTSGRIREALKRGRCIGEEVNRCRTLANTPGGDMTPKLLARAARSAVRGTRVRTRVFGRADLKRLNMGAVLGVAQGSAEEPQFITMEYRGGSSSERPIVLVGKGVTFDTGGLNLKPSDALYEMHMDMSGGAVVIHTMALIAKLNVRKNVIALIPAVENMPSGSSYRPGDILKTLSGKTVEVLNTDAEGRLILADALTYAARYTPRLVVDVATLTGAALVALGQHASAILTRDRALERLLRDAGEETGDRVWPLPLWDVYEQYVKGNFADVANVPATGNQRYGGAINGGMFLFQFVKDYSGDTTWAHIDMAPRMTAAPGDHLAKGATGEPLRLLHRLVERY